MIQIGNKKYHINVNYFNKIDSEEKAYWLGFIWCDAYIGTRYKSENYKEYWFELSLNMYDDDHLYKFNKSLSSNYPIKFIKNKDSKSKNDSKVTTRIYNKIFCESLVNEYDFIPYRTSIFKMKNKVPEHLTVHFIRGVMDSNGSFSEFYDNYNNKKEVMLQFSSRSTELLSFIQDYLIHKEIKLKQTKIKHDKGCYDFKVKGKYQFYNTLTYLYENSTIYLNRKYEKYKKIIEGEIYEMEK